MATISTPLPESAVAPVTPAVIIIQLTKWRAPRPVTKIIYLDQNGVLVKESTASSLSEGTIERLECTPEQFAKDVLPGIGSTESLSYGIPKDSAASRVLSLKKLAKRANRNGAIARTTDNMIWPAGPAIVMVDYDPYGESILNREGLLDALHMCCAAIRDTAHVWMPSTSSCIYNADAKVDVTGVRGQRVYIVVADGTDIPRASCVLIARSWLAGYGHIAISKAGSLLVRGIIDAAVFQTNRIDYCAPPVCLSPLVSRRPPPVLLGNPTLVLDTRQALPDLSDEEQVRFEALVAEAKVAARPEADRIRADYMRSRIDELVAQGMPVDVATTVINAAVETRVLHADFPLLTETGETIKVRELLANKSKWHGRRFADPVEPTYHGDSRIARAHLLCARPHIYSFAHGGITYRLSHTRRTVRVEGGARTTYMNQIVEAIADAQAAYRMCDQTCSIDTNGRIKILDEAKAMTMIDENVRLEKYDGRARKVVAIDATKQIADLLLRSYSRQLPELKVVLTAPVMHPESGEILDRPGFDERGKSLLIEREPFYPVPDDPSVEEIREALQLFWAPVRLFPFAMPLDQAVALTAMLTAIVRPILPTSPAFALDAPIQGSGKTLLGMTIFALTGAEPTVTPPISDRDDTEMRKSLLAHMLSGNSALLIDNIVGDFDSPSLAAFLTSTTYSSRILGASQIVTGSTNTLVLVSGNNLTIKGDLPRRILVCRIDPHDDMPHQREFSFDPVRVVQDGRQEFAAAGLTLLRAAFRARTDARLGKGRSASFEVWDDVVRQTVCWLAEQQRSGQIPSGKLSDDEVYPVLQDPNDAISTAVQDDPEMQKLRRFLTQWETVFGFGSSARDGKTVQEALTDIARARMTKGPNGQLPTEPGDLHDTLVEIAGDPKTQQVNTRSLGKWLGRNVDRQVSGVCLRRGPERNGVATWYVEAVAVAAQGFGGFTGFVPTPAKEVSGDISYKEGKTISPNP